MKIINEFLCIVDDDDGKFRRVEVNWLAVNIERSKQREKKREGK